MKNCLCFTFMVLTALLMKSCVSNDDLLNPKFVFLSNRVSPKGEFDIFISSLNDSIQFNLTKDIQFIRSISRPRLSPDNSSLLYVSFNKNANYLTLLDMITKEEKYLTEINLDIPNATFIQNGKKILYEKKVNGKKQMFILEVDDEGEKNISSSPGVNEFNPQLSEDGTTLVFLRQSNKAISIVIRNLRTEKEHVIKVNGNQINPSFWGKNNIVYESYVDDSYKIFTFKNISGEVEQITTGGSNANNPFIVNDGKSLVFVSDGRGRRFKDICLLDLKTKKFELVTKDLNYINFNMSIQENREGIVFESSSITDSEIYYLSLTDYSLTNISKNKAWDCQPSF